jgi:DNA-binding PadR family transcriptional regulator
MPIPQNIVCCKKEFAEFKVLMSKALKHRGKHRQKYLDRIDEFFCDKVYEITMCQRRYFMEVLNEKKTINNRLQSVLNKNSFLEDANATLRQKLAVKGVFSHNLASSNESAS